MPVFFYRVNEPYGAFSNFAKYGFEVNGKFWQTSEHYFQAQKFASTIHEEEVRLAPSPREAARIGRDQRLPLRPDWEDVKVHAMRDALRHKFRSHETLVELLLSTGDEEIIERTTDDYYWGCGADGTGLNMLGKLLMELRAEYQARLRQAGNS
jgi:ribA/ribD-fused uncharacterized protein